MVKKGKRLETGESMVVLCCYDRILETRKLIKKRSLGSGDGVVQSIKCLLHKHEDQSSDHQCACQLAARCNWNLSAMCRKGGGKRERDRESGEQGCHCSCSRLGQRQSKYRPYFL